MFPEWVLSFVVLFIADALVCYIVLACPALSCVAQLCCLVPADPNLSCVRVLCVFGWVGGSGFACKRPKETRTEGRMRKGQLGERSNGETNK